MKKFQFRLNKVLEVREIEQELAENRLFQANKAAREIEDKIDNMENKQSEIYDFIRKKSLSVHEHQLARGFLKTNRCRISQTEEKLASQQEKIARCQQKYIKKRQKTEVLKNLKEKDYKNYHKELLLKEQKELDEIGIRTDRIQGG